MKKRISLLMVVIMLFVANITSVYAEPRAVAKTESESNNTYSTADVVNQDDTIYGKISSSSDVDIFKVTFAVPGIANFWLGDIPSGKDYDLYVYNSSGQQLGSSTGTSSSELVSFQTIGATTYYFKVVGSGGDYDTNNEYKVRSRIILLDYNYFCQNNMSLSSPSFTTTNVDKLYSYDSNGNTTSDSWLEQIKKSGCVISSMAMILRNLNVRTANTQYDVRTNTSYKMQADPISVAYANTLFPTITASGSTYIANTQNNPIYANYNNIATGFGRTASVYDLTGTDTAKANAIAYQLTLNPEGVAVSFRDSANNTHTIVFTATTYEVPKTYSFTLNNSQNNDLIAATRETAVVSEESISAWETNMKNKAINTRASSYDSMFTVSDPVSTSSYSGNQVLFANSYTASEYSFGNAYRLIVIN